MHHYFSCERPSPSPDPSNSQSAISRLVYCHSAAALHGPGIRVTYHPCFSVRWRVTTVPRSFWSRWSGLSVPDIPARGLGGVAAHLVRAAPGILKQLLDQALTWGTREAFAGKSGECPAPAKDRPGTQDHGLGASGDISCHFRHRNHDHERSVAPTWATTVCRRDVVRSRLRRRLVRQRPVGGVMGVQAGRRAEGGSPPANAVSIDVHDLTSGDLGTGRCPF